jgi:hypothetical protein
LLAPPSYAATAVYVVPPTNNTQVLPNTILPTGLASRTVTITACKGEYEPATFVIRNTSSTAIPGAVVAVTNLIRSGGSETIPAANVDIRVVKCWWQAGSGIADLTDKQLVPELLLKDDSLVRVSETAGTNELKVSGNYVLISDPNGVILNGVKTDIPTTAQFPVQDATAIQPFDIPASSNKQLWVTVQVPATAIAGTYSGTITIGNTGGGAAAIHETLTLNVVVPGFTLLPPGMTCSLYYTGYLADVGTISNNGKNSAQFTAEMKDLATHGVTTPTLYNQRSDANLASALSIRTAQGVSNSDLYYLGLNINSYGANTTALQNEVGRVKALVQPYGVNQLLIYGIDETDLTPFVSQINVVHTAGAKVFCAENSEAKVASALGAGLDLLISAGPPTVELADLWHNSGREIFSYANPQGGEEKPASYRRNYGMTLREQDYDGAMTYAYQHSFGNGWNDFDSLQYRDHNLTYPTANGVIDTIAWEGFREAVDDVRYATTLDTKIAQVLAGGDANLKKTAKAAQAWLNGFLASKIDLDSMRARMTRYLLRLNNLVASPEATSPDLVGHWGFEGIASLPRVSDKSGWENTGELVNMAAEVADGTAFTVGKIEDAIRLNPSKSQYVDCGTGDSLRNTSTAITVAAWVKLTSDVQSQIISCSDTSSYARYRLNIQAGKLNLYVTTGTQGWHNGGQGQVRTWTDGWHHIAWTYDSATNTTKFYVDGALDFSSTTINIGAMTNAPLRYVRIGGNENNKYFDGDMDEVRIYNRALAQNEVQQLALGGSLRAKWSFEEPAGTEVFTDDSGWSNIGNPSVTTSYSARVSGKRGNGLRLQQAKSQYVDFGAAASLQDTSNAITVAAWVKPASDVRSQVICCSDTSSYARYRLNIQAGKLNLYVTTATQGWHNGGQGQVRTWTDGWHHIAWTYDSASHTTKFYVDGALDFSSTTISSGAMPNAPLKWCRVGGNENSSYFDGDLDEVRIYDRALTQAEIAQDLSF